jgi:hypothetical protein
MTEAELETERLALLTEEQALLKEHEGLQLTPNDRHGHAAHYERLKAHQDRTAEFKEALRQRRRADAPRSASHCPVCQSDSVMPLKRPHEYRCLTCRAVWIMGSSQNDPPA